MKKAILILIILIIAAGAVLYFGWVNVKPGFFAIAHSTIAGTIEYPLESGKIHWLWQKLVPKSFHLYMVERKPLFLSLETSHSLPGSEQLEEFGKFDLTVHVDLQYSIGYDAAIRLIQDGLFDEFHIYLSQQLSSQVDEAVADFILDSMTRQYGNDRDISYSLLDVLEENIEKEIRELVATYNLDDASWHISYTEVPQLGLYNDALSRYFSHLEKVYRFKEAELDRESEHLALEKIHDLEIDRWEKYGKLIQKYPELLKYFYIEKFSEQADVLVIPQNEITGFPKMLDPWQLPLQKPPETKERPVPSTKEEKEQAQHEDEATPIQDTGDTEEAAEQPETAVSEFSQEEPVSEEGAEWYEKLMFWRYLGIGKGE